MKITIYTRPVSGEEPRAKDLFERISRALSPELRVVAVETGEGDARIEARA